MTVEVSTPGRTILPGQAVTLRIEPYLHLGEDRIFNPLTDLLLEQGQAGYAPMRALLAGATKPSDLAPEVVTLLSEAGWLVPDDDRIDRRFRLKYVSLEANTNCNQSCYFCPVSVAPRKNYRMPTELYERILDELSAYKDTIESVFMINYNEPTADPRFLEQVRSIKEHGLAPSTLTNATGLTPQRTDALVEMGGLAYLSVNLSTLDRERYARDRGGDHLDLVLKHVDYMADKEVAPTMEIVVLGTGDENHQRDTEEIRARYRGTRFEVKHYEVMDRAGLLTIGNRPEAPHRGLCGCENVGSRPLQHIHITPQGKCVLCCEDYDERYVVGDLNEETVTEVLEGDRLAELRRWIYGLDEAPADFLCRRCIYALTD